MVLLFVSNAVSHNFLQLSEPKFTNADYIVSGFSEAILPRVLDMGELKYGFQTCVRLPRHVW